MTRISYRCLPEERSLPFVSKSLWYVYLGDACVGRIYVDNSENRSPNLRVWKPIVYEPSFDPLEFPHADEAMPEPYVLTNDSDDEHNLELHSPSLMTLYEARQYMCSIVERGQP